MEHWEIWAANSIGGQGYDLVTLGISDSLPPHDHALDFPQLGEIPLMKLLVDVYNIPDTTTDRILDIHVATEMLDHFSFSDPWGNSIGIALDTVPDTNWFFCLEWEETVCVSWQQVSGPPADSIFIDTITVPILDTAEVHVTDGSLTVLQPICGDVDGSIADANVADLTYLVEYLFKSGPPPPYPPNADLDGSPGINVADLTHLVEYLFKLGPAPLCN